MMSTIFDRVKMECECILAAYSYPETISAWSVHYFGNRTYKCFLIKKSLAELGYVFNYCDRVFYKK